MHIAKSPTPLLRGLAALFAIYGAFVATSIPFMILGLSIVLATLIAQGRLLPFLQFSGAIILPIGLGLLFVWGFLRQGTPTANTGHSIQVGVVYATVTTLRLALLGAVFQATFLSLSIPKLVDLLQSFGIRGRLLAIVASTLNLWPDFRRHVEQVIAGRCARGLMRDRRLLTRLRQMPFTVRTIFITSLGHSVERADAWEASGLIDQLGKLGLQAEGSQNYSRIAGVGWLTLAATWATAATLAFR